MGCYGIGVNRIIAALIETSHDDNGIIWPMTLAPYEVVLSPVNVNQTRPRRRRPTSSTGIDRGRHRGAAGRPRRRPA